ncbi:hypothetical protein [uncultured Amnibacterium sp.]|uniref:hypothetical protein n=1 Tax=uncultured Amnibacterium sp. TaxID=1631851 RepID=UPI0035CAA647
MTDPDASRSDGSSRDDAARAVTPDRTAEVAPSTTPTATGAGRTAAAPQYGERTDRTATLQREKAEFGGMRFFLAFFGWLTATGAVVLMSAIVAGILAALGVPNSASKTAGNTAAVQTAGVLGFVVLAVLLFVGYYIGGYVAGRMARFSGLKQGLAVWLWAVIIAVLVAAAGAVASTSVGAFSQLNTAGLPISGSLATSAGIIALVVAIVFSLVGALLGGLGGMRFHRKVDRFAGNA